MDSVLIAMAVYDTEENKRSEYTEVSLVSLLTKVDFNRHTLFISDNGSCAKTQDVYRKIERVYRSMGFPKDNLIIHKNGENLGTARAINQALKRRKEGQHVIKIDNDVVIHHSGWVDEMSEAVSRDENIGIIGLKRKDIDFDPNHENEDYRSELIGLPHNAGQRWIIVEKGWAIMGTCVLFNSRLIDAIGYMSQPSVYGFDDTIYSMRSVVAGFWNCYLPHIHIDHIDDGANPYTQVKHQQAAEAWDEYRRLHDGYLDQSIPVYYDGGFSDEV